ncbi:hypothetical protein HDC36_003408 [Xanthomonas sp. JAI131]|uniref:hypothetical protein n=1 Tax=Xanthomonas sp. JAI131 TaxID=2723067 RepID=UPI0015CA8861|nr:hypothetical protein [Xanthomonas sp. JAI131]NYF21932.1 hypothetical protein [Xanthomonas sp. JAI131]
MKPEITVASPFCRIPVDDGHLLQVNAGINTDTALFRASQINEHVREFLWESMTAAQASDDALHVSIPYDTADFLHFLLGMAEALRKAAGAEG